MLSLVVLLFQLHFQGFQCGTQAGLHRAQGQTCDLRDLPQFKLLCEPQQYHFPLCAQLCLAYNLNPDKALKKHQDFMEKVCPAKLINEGRWDEFCAAVKQKYTELKAAGAEN